MNNTKKIVTYLGKFMKFTENSRLFARPYPHFSQNNLFFPRFNGKIFSKPRAKIYGKHFLANAPRNGRAERIDE